MFKAVKTYARKHNSFIIIGIAALCVFFTNYYFEILLSPEEYGAYSLFITYLGTIYSFGFLGLEQAVLRLVDAKNKDRVRMSSYFFISLLAIGFVFCLVASVLLKRLAFSEYEGIIFYKIFVISYMLVLSMLVYNILRLRMFFLQSQLATNVWKFVLLLVALIYSGSQLLSFYMVFNAVFWFSLVWIVVCVYILLNSVSWGSKENVEEVSAYWGHFFLAIISITVLLFVDRYIVQFKLGTSEFGRYFYIANIFLFPFGLFQNYFGFKQLVKYKSNFSIRIFKRDVMRATTVSSLLIIFLVVFVYLISNSGWISINFNEDLYLIVAFLLLGFVRVVYSIISAAVGARIEIKRFRILNLQSIVSLLLLALLLFYIGDTKEVIVFVVILMWITRCLIYVRSILKGQ